MANEMWLNGGMARTRHLPRNFRSNLHVHTMDQLATALDIVNERALHSEPASVARTRAINLSTEIRDEAFRRRFRFVRCFDGYGYEKFGS